MRRTFLIALAIGLAILLGYFFYSGVVENVERQRIETAQRERINRERRMAIAQLVEQTNAIDDWEKQLLRGQSYRLEPILTLELERLWMSGRPILFLGAIDDIKTYDQNAYTVVFSQSSTSAFAFTTDAELHLSLRCARKDIDALLSATPNLFADAGWNNVVVVIADITGIRTERVAVGDDGKKETRIGDGSCLRVLYVGAPQELRPKSR